MQCRGVAVGNVTTVQGFKEANPKYTKGFQNPKVEEMQKNAETF